MPATGAGSRRTSKSSFPSKSVALIMCDEKIKNSV
jgi:hypothetical protein